jgi:uncharacterized membrane protein YkvA (DUF1232 family)
VVPWLIVVAAAALVLYAAGVVALVALGRRRDARALAGFIPDCLVLFKRLIADPRVDRRRKGLLFGMVAYLAMPVDLIPDFIPVAGQLDDAILAAVVLRSVLRGAGYEVVREHWPGPERSLRVILRLALAPEHDGAAELRGAGVASEGRGES